MHNSGNLVFVAAVPKELCEAVENGLIWQGRQQLIYNRNGKIVSPSLRIELVHDGAAPKLQEFEVCSDTGVVQNLPTSRATASPPRCGSAQPERPRCGGSRCAEALDAS